MTAAAVPEIPKPKIRPATVWPIILALLVFAALVTPEERNDSPDFRLTTYSSGAYGARGIYEVLTSLGWRTSRWEHPLDAGLDTNAVYVILQPVAEVTQKEHHALLRMVRNGGRILIVSPDSELVTEFGMAAVEDSTSLTISSDSPALKVKMKGTVIIGRDSLQGNAPSGLSAAGDSAGITHRKFSGSPIFRSITEQSYLKVRTLPPEPTARAVFLWQSSRHADSAVAPAYMLGRSFGRGRVVVLADPQLAANDVVRQGNPAMAIERAVEWLNPPNRQVIFDEYHQGYHGQASGSVIIDALTDTPAGRVALQLVFASLVFLVAIGVRAILPTPVTVLQRRSPLEHVDALARAYTQIHATRLGAQRLLRGIRRRHPMGVTVDTTAGGRDTSNDLAYLDAVRARYGIAPDDVTALTNALRRSVDDDEFLQAGRAAGRIEQSIITQ